MKAQLICLLISVVTLAGCFTGCQTAGTKRKTSKPTLSVTARPTNTAGLSAEEINRAAKLCINKCVRCHDLYDPAAYGDVEWQSWMAKMAKKAHLKEDQAELLSRYFEAFRSSGTAAPGH